MQKPDNKELNAPILSEQKKDTDPDPDERVKENTKVVNDEDKESDIQASKAVAADDDQYIKINIRTGNGCFKEDELSKERIPGKGEYWGGSPERKTRACAPYAPDKAGYNQDEIVNGVIIAMLPSLTS